MDEMTWDAPPAPGLLRDGALRVALTMAGGAARLIGRLDEAVRLTGLSMGGYAPGEAPAILRIARDKALALASPAALDALPEGWSDGLAVSRCDGAWGLLHVSGPEARAAMERVTAVNLDRPSPSAAMRFNGASGGLLRGGDGWTLVIPAPTIAFHAAALLALPVGDAGIR